jgi:hypothetical protein
MVGCITCAWGYRCASESRFGACPPVEHLMCRVRGGGFGSVRHTPFTGRVLLATRGGAGRHQAMRRRETRPTPSRASTCAATDALSCPPEERECCSQRQPRISSLVDTCVRASTMAYCHVCFIVPHRCQLRLMCFVCADRHAVPVGFGSCPMVVVVCVCDHESRVHLTENVSAGRTYIADWEFRLT